MGAGRVQGRRTGGAGAQGRPWNERGGHHVGPTHRRGGRRRGRGWLCACGWWWVGDVWPASACLPPRGGVGACLYTLEGLLPAHPTCRPAPLRPIPQACQYAATTGCFVAPSEPENAGKPCGAGFYVFSPGLRLCTRVRTPAARWGVTLCASCCAVLYVAIWVLLRAQTSAFLPPVVRPARLHRLCGLHRGHRWMPRPPALHSALQTRCGAATLPVAAAAAAAAS